MPLNQTCSKHTAHPWKVMRRANQTGTKQILVVSVPAGNKPLAEINLRDESAPANADLMAAAPELLEALKAIYAGVCVSGNDRRTNLNVSVEAFKQMESAIAKAEGR